MIDTLAADRSHILEAAGELWEPLRGERVFVTGGTGFVGTWLMEAFAAANRAYGLGARATLLTRSPQRFAARAPHLAADPSIDLLEGDATTFPSPAGSYAFVVHAATERSFAPDAERPLGIVEPDMRSTRRVLNFAVTHGTRRVLFTSSGAVYGSGAAGLERVPETYLGAPDVLEERSAYGESKRLSEYAVTAYARIHGFEAVVGRLFAFVGPFLPLDEGYAVGNFLNDVLQGRPVRIGGDGTAIRSYLYGADLAVWLWTIALRGRTGTAYNVGSGEALSIRRLAETVVETLAPGTPVLVAREPIEGAAPNRYVPDVSRARNELSLVPRIGLEEALRRSYCFHRSLFGKTAQR